MDAEKDEIENLYGYHDLYELTALFTTTLPLVVKVIKELEKELANLVVL